MAKNASSEKTAPMPTIHATGMPRGDLAARLGGLPVADGLGLDVGWEAIRGEVINEVRKKRATR